MVSIFEKSKHLCPVEKQAGESFLKNPSIYARSKSKQEKARRLFGATDGSHQPAMPTVKPFFGVFDF